MDAFENELANFDLDLEHATGGVTATERDLPPFSLTNFDRDILLDALEDIIDNSPFPEDVERAKANRDRLRVLGE